MPTLTELPRWTIRTSGDQATFTYVPAGGDPVAPPVRGGRGLALREADLPGFAKALGEVMKLPTYWTARARAGRLSLDGDPAWSEPRLDPADGFVHVAGPCDPPEAGGSFTVALADVRALRVRIAAYLHRRG
ncbi:hypothetical protein [Amycolatopsis rifamycinica]|uniref:Uncharacterized protein n=1 Tax=Amycolatopsis rifamycinica TaxID=287986 RepID=A0A066U4Q4_9PSEU|nr:hypothetical protein [Amycolatopsis rifamycinica]KDN19163.1 hypothetical protein DV20_26260 [Amycolatopsis rifamycinica]